MILNFDMYELRADRRQTLSELGESSNLLTLFQNIHIYSYTDNGHNNHR